MTSLMLSVVIPALNAADSLASTLEAVAGAAPVSEIIVADGGSTDQTGAVAARFGARFVDAPRGRGFQMEMGARDAEGEWLLFLHADTVLGAGWAEEAGTFMDDESNRERAGVFRLALDDPAPAARRLERLANWRAARLGLPYGDQGLLISRPFYDRLGGFKLIHLMEDVDMARRIGRRRLVFLGSPAVTSAARYRRGGYVARPLFHLFCLGLYFLGVSPRLIARIYR